MPQRGSRGWPLCSFTFDGTRLDAVGVRQKGGVGSTSNLAGKPAFSVKSNEFVAGQRLDGLAKLWLTSRHGE